MGGAVTKAAGTAVSAAASTTVKTLHAIDAQLETSEESKFQKKVATTAWPTPLAHACRRAMRALALPHHVLISFAT